MTGHLSSREKTLSIAVGAIVFLFVNFFVFDKFTKDRARLAAALQVKAGQLQLMQVRLKDKEKWAQREAWLASHQPVLANEDLAGVQLLDRVKELAKKHDITILSSAIRVPARRAEATAVAVEVKTKSPWKSLIGFLAELQHPDQFVVLERSNLKVDDKENTLMRGEFTIAKWYAPAGAPR
jgi:Type II secretion system (T2SS), protein M subtype b